MNDYRGVRFPSWSNHPNLQANINEFTWNIPLSDTVRIVQNLSQRPG